MHRNRWITVFAMVGVLAAPAAFAPVAAGASTNIVVNGGFEKPHVDVYEVYSTGMSFNGWKVVDPSGGGDAGLVSDTFRQEGFSFPAETGTQWVDLTGLDNSMTGVRQTLDLTVGSKYKLTFWVGNTYDPSGMYGTTSTVDVHLGSTTLMTAVNSLHGTNKTQVWKKFTKTFTATQASEKLTFVNGDPPSDGNNGLDAVSVTPTT